MIRDVFFIYDSKDENKKKSKTYAYSQLYLRASFVYSLKCSWSNQP